jgi:energy-converting hydrogenase B subunit D
MDWDASLLWQFDLLLLLMAVICAIAALSLKDLISCAVLGGVYSFLLCLVWTEMLAIDVAFTEAAVGAGISTILILGTVLHLNRRSKD